MAALITTYAGLLNGMLSWMAREGDARLTARFDDFLLNAERRIYFGFATDSDSPLRSDPLRIPEMETDDPAFTPGATGVVSQPAGFLELISVYSNTNKVGPVPIVAQKAIDGYGGQSIGCFRVAVSGTNFRFWDLPAATDTFTIRTYQKLTTPAGSTVNAILTTYPDVYLYAVLIEAATFIKNQQSVEGYLMLYNASVAGLNARRQRITAEANPTMRLRGVATP